MRQTRKITQKRAHDLRKSMTQAEILLWSRLRRKQLADLRFRRQVPIEPYIVDFACIERKLIIEVDGDTHSTDKERQYDQRRTAVLQQQGWYVHRVWNRDVYDNLEGVLEGILILVEGPNEDSPHQ